MKSENVQIEVVGKVAVATICNPPANALTPELRTEFTAKLGELSKNDQVWSLIVTGDGEKFFMAGADIPGLAELDRERGLDRVRRTRKFFSALDGFEKPVIAAINGLCLGGGLELALVCDIRIAADHVKLGLPEVNLGLIPGAGGPQRLPSAVGPGWANYLLFTGDAISAEAALGIGLVQKLVPLTSLREAALELANKINSKGPLAVRAAKRVSARGFQQTLEKGLDMENEAFSELCATHDKNEGVTAFLEKRKPKFQGK
ncbi:MAG: enoyl-CoA hydratase/isomerase family protein [Deltaproteobacteria bacterium]|nr:enoyl-CoA hydratase/isomerase family protein [Deltaproteobacteria bacterium]